MPLSQAPQTLFHKPWQRLVVEQTGDGEALLAPIGLVSNPQPTHGDRPP